MDPPEDQHSCYRILQADHFPRCLQPYASDLRPRHTCKVEFLISQALQTFQIFPVFLHGGRRRPQIPQLVYKQPFCCLVPSRLSIVNVPREFPFALSFSHHLSLFITLFSKKWGLKFPQEHAKNTSKFSLPSSGLSSRRRDVRAHTIAMKMS